MKIKPPSGQKKQTQTKPVLSAVEWANFFKSISAPKEGQENKAVMVAHRRYEYQLQILRTGFIRCFFGLTVRFFTHLGVEFGFDYLFGPGCLYELLRPYFDRAVHEFRYIIDNNTRLVIFRVFLRQ